jgi:predicted DNA-binding transcriptional regulator AlpA
MLDEERSAVGCLEPEIDEWIRQRVDSSREA